MRVVQAPLGDGCASDTDVEDVGAAEYRERCEVAAEGPAANRDPGQIQELVQGSNSVKRIDLILKDRDRPGPG